MDSVKFLVYNAAERASGPVRAERVGARTWMLVSESGQCQPLKYLKKNRETAPNMMARIKDIDSNGPPPNQELFRWLDSEKQFNQTLKRVKAAIDEFFEEGEQYE
jgi:hypothetical protein